MLFVFCDSLFQSPCLTFKFILTPARSFKIVEILYQIQNTNFFQESDLKAPLSVYELLLTKEDAQRIVIRVVVSMLIYVQDSSLSSFPPVRLVQDT